MQGMEVNKKEDSESSSRMPSEAVPAKKEGQEASYSQRKSSPCQRQLGALAACGAGWLGSGCSCPQTGQCGVGWLLPRPAGPGNTAALGWAW